MKLIYRTYGEGPPLIILHGLYGSSDNWVSIARVFANQFKVILPDNRNHGQSPHDNEHTYDAMVNDLNELMEDLTIPQAYIMGHSMGGKVAMFFSLKYPQKVIKLVVVDISPKSYIGEFSLNSHLNEHKTILSTISNMEMANIGSRKEVDKLMQQKIPSARIRQFLLKNLKRNKKNEFYWIINTKVLSDSLIDILDGLPEGQYFENEQIGFSVLFIKGQMSNYISDDEEEKLKMLYPNSEIVTIPNAGHWVHAEQPELFLEALNSFLNP